MRLYIFSIIKRKNCAFVSWGDKIGFDHGDASYYVQMFMVHAPLQGNGLNISTLWKSTTYKDKNCELAALYLWRVYTFDYFLIMLHFPCDFLDSSIDINYLSSKKLYTI